MKKNICDFDLNEKKVIIRCDFNVPMKDGKIMDDTRIQESLKTIQYAIDHNAIVILLSHLGRVKEEADLVKYNLAPVAKRLSECLHHPVLFCNKTRGQTLENTIANMHPKDVLLLQNTRYEDLDGKKESKNDPELGAYWASLGDIFINDAFGTAHRSHASNVGIASHLPSGVGFLIEKELHILSSLKEPEYPYVVILGGAKVQDKIGVIENLAPKADHLMIGGGMAFTFLKAQGYAIGSSLCDEENIPFCQKMLDLYADKIMLPKDVNVTTSFSNDTPSHITTIDHIETNEMGMDIGPETIKAMQDVLQQAKTVLWNGPLGVYEFETFRKGTESILSYLTTIKTKTILGGGDIVACASELGYKDKVTHASTGGGATLTYLEGKPLPGIDCIDEK